MKGKVVLVLSILFLIFACSAPEEEMTVEQQLQKGAWVLVEAENTPVNLLRGMIFSDHNHIISIDSQGHSIPPSHDINYSIYGDTLKIIDYKYIPQVIFEKGTFMFIIEDLTEDEMVLQLFHPEPKNRLVYKKN